MGDESGSDVDGVNEDGNDDDKVDDDDDDDVKRNNSDKAAAENGTFQPVTLRHGALRPLSSYDDHHI